MNTKIFLISGKARHGKTTLANMIKDYYESRGIKSVVTSYNKYIKIYAKELIGWDGDDDSKPRAFLQSIGSDVIRGKLGLEDYFVRRMDEDILIYKEYVSAVMIDDVRFPLELDFFKEKYPDNAISIRIKRPSYVSELSEEEQQHNTEVGLDNYEDYDYTILNDGSLEDLRAKVDAMMGEMMK